MDNMFASILSHEVFKFILVIIIITCTAFIIWILLREMRLWYWKVNNTQKNIKNIEKRMKRLEGQSLIINSNIEIINENLQKINNIFEESMINISYADSNDENEDTEDIEM